MKMTIRKCWRVQSVDGVQGDSSDIVLPVTLVGARPNRLEAAKSRGDWWEVMEDPDEDGVMFVININRSLPYAGLSEFHLHPDGWRECHERSYFFQESSVSELGDFDNIENTTVVRRLLEFAHDRY